MSITQFLEQRHVPFEIVPHEACYSAQHLAQALHTPGRQVASGGEDAHVRADLGEDVLRGAPPDAGASGILCMHDP